VTEALLDYVSDEIPSLQSRGHEDSLLDISIIIVSFNTRDVLRECLDSVFEESRDLRAEVFVVENASTDGSAEMVEQEFPTVRLLRSKKNLGFGAANNLALQHASGRFFVLLNSDAFFAPGALALAVKHMEEKPDCALGGCLLVGRDGVSQPSSRSFHTLLGDAIVLTGLAAKFPESKFFGQFDRTWADQNQASIVDWVPGAFSIVRPQALRKVGLFDPDFFLYYEEVDLCLRIKEAGMKVWYWPDVVVTHIGGESSRQLEALDFSSHAAQVVKWRMRSTLLYYRKHHGFKVLFAKWLEKTVYLSTVLRNMRSSDPWRQERARHHRVLIRLMDQAWEDTKGGRVSPPRPW
jgi:GT2 family glycosyltransferase